MADNKISFVDAFRFWLKLGLISFGGPAGQIAIMHQELVEKRRWLSEKRFLHALSYCMVLPGPEAQQLATYIGWLMHRTLGGFIAGLLFILPSLILLIALSWAYMIFGHVPWIAGLFYGVKPAVTAIVLQAALRVGGRALSHWSFWVIAVAAFVALAVFYLPFPLIIVTAAAIGVVGGRMAPDTFRDTGHKTAQTPHAPAVIDDDTPSPAHARFRWPRLIAVFAVGVLLWGLPFAALGLCLGWQHPMTLMALFFSQAALLTFGGAYAVLPYIQQAAVSQYGWLTAPQMMDGLALGETTPGPLIMVVTFVGFVAAWQNGWWPGHESLAAIAGAVIVTWFTFLPSFVFILAGGPIVESSRGDLTFTAPLTAITAAVVGVIANLAVFFAGHVLWPKGIEAPIDGVALMIMIAAAVALIRFRVNVMAVIAACATVGMIVSIWR